MKRTIIIACAISLALAACNSQEKSETKETTAGNTADTSTVEKANDHTWVMPDSATMTKNWMAYMTPGEAHAVMAKANGTWNAAIKMWEKPGAPQQDYKGSAVFKMVMGGRYQQSNYSGQMMGMPFEGMSLMGFDNATKTFTSTWIDNMGTGTMTLTGPWDEATKTITMTGKITNPGTSTPTQCEERQVMKMVDDNTQVMEMYTYSPEGKEYKAMEITYTRKK